MKYFWQCCISSAFDLLQLQSLLTHITTCSNKKQEKYHLTEQLQWKQQQSCNLFPICKMCLQCLFILSCLPFLSQMHGNRYYLFCTKKVQFPSLFVLIRKLTGSISKVNGFSHLKCTTLERIRVTTRDHLYTQLYAHTHTTKWNRKC